MNSQALKKEGYHENIKIKKLDGEKLRKVLFKI